MLCACEGDYSVWAVSPLVRTGQRSRVGASRLCRPHSVTCGVHTSALSWGWGRGSEADDKASEDPTESEQEQEVQNSRMIRNSE